MKYCILKSDTSVMVWKQGNMVKLLLLLVVTVISASEYEYVANTLDVTLDEDWDNAVMRNARVKRVVQKQPKQKNDGLQICKANDGRSGFCRQLRDCVPEYENNMWVKNNCIFNNTSMGVCCPHGTKRGGVRGLTDSLPAIVTPVEEQAFFFPETRGCGVSNRGLRLLHGKSVARPGDWPWMVYISDRNRTPNRVWCGGSLITERHVLTAAHCFRSENTIAVETKDLEVRLGEYHTEQKNETLMVMFNVTEVHVHEQYQWSIYRHDIAILKLEKPCKFNTYIWPICLPPRKLPDLTGKNLTATGWGTISLTGPRSKELREVVVSVINQTQCNIIHSNGLFDTNLCAGGTKRDTCQYDSGGPLMCRTKSGRWMVVGLTAWGEGCGTKPGVYTRVDSYVDWIQRNTDIST